MKKEQVKKVAMKKNPPGKVPAMKKENSWKRNTDLFALAVIILLGIIVYSNSFNCSFHFDDFYNIVDNVKIRNLLDVKAWWNFYPTRPVAVFTFALNYHFNQYDVTYWHLVNLIIHLINACLVYWLTMLIFSSPSLKDQKIARHKKILAFLTALMFVSHPLATQSVTYIVQRMTSMVSMLYFFSLLLYIKARITAKGNTAKILLFAGSFISAVLAMLTKENAFTLPFAIGLVEFFFIRTKRTINFKDYRVILLIAVVLCLILIIPLQQSVSIFKPIPPVLGHNSSLTPFTYFLTEFSVIVKYIQLLFIPVNQNVDYHFPVSDNFFEIRTLLSFLVLLSLIIFSVYIFKKQRIISFGIFWFFLTLAVESSIIPIYDVIFEHRTYLPSFGFFLALSSAVYILLWEKYKFLAIAVFAIIIGSNSYLTFERNKVWKDDLTLWTDNVAKAPAYARPLYNRGQALGILQQWDMAIADYSRAIEINPSYADAYYNRGNAFGAIQQWDKAIADYSRVIGITPTFTDAYYNRGIAFGNLREWDKAIADYSKTITIDPKYKQAYVNRGIAYGNLGQLTKAIDDFNEVLKIDPNYTIATTNREIALKILNSRKSQ